MQCSGVGSPGGKQCDTRQHHPGLAQVSISLPLSPCLHGTREQSDQQKGGALLAALCKHRRNKQRVCKPHKNSEHFHDFSWEGLGLVNARPAAERGQGCDARGSLGGHREEQGNQKNSCRATPTQLPGEGSTR